MSNNSQSENGENESVSIVGIDEVIQHQKEEEGAVEADRLTLSSVNSSMSGASQSGSDTEGDGEHLDGEEGPETHMSSDDGELMDITTKQILFESESHGNAISSLVLFSVILFIVPLSGMYISYQFIFTDYFHLPRDRAILYGGLVAAALVYIILGIFAWIAYREEQTAAQHDEGKKTE